ncbi:4Fe-4S dicluster domain-containing protein [Halomonas sp. MA07-2]|uniref:4Fe-4S dicluster domain-containing protein n=1 Tax=unclassified Halomonas TaxID=2609666 RepID=UPI003EEDB529
MPSLLTPSALRHSQPGIGWISSRCLQAPPHPLACTRCIDACPVEALAFHEDDDDGVSLLASDACHGCGQCLPACPSEALVSADIEALVVGQTEGEPLRLGCHRVMETEHSPLTRLHCLHALGPDLLASLAARATPEAVALHLPEGCHGCDAAPAEPERWLEQARRFCHISNSPASSDFRAARPSVSRRDLLRGRPAPRLPAIADDDAAPKARRLQRQRAAAEALGDTRVAPILPGLALNTDACRAHSVCARVCPTEALRETPEGELTFDPQACLDCGHCLTACPEGALATGESIGKETVTLRKARRIDCFLCGRPFTPHAGEDTPDDIENATTCPACRREAALMQESFDDHFG